MRHLYIQPRMEVADMTPQQIICASGEGWAQISGYRSNSGGGFIQEEP